MVQILPPPPGPWVPPRPDLEPSPRPRRRRGRTLVVVGVIVSLVVLQFAALGVFEERAPVDGEHAFILTTRDGVPVRWDPCEPIHYEVNNRYAAPGAVGDVQEAVDRVSEATGIEFVYDGRTERTPDEAIDVQFLSVEGGQKHYLPLLVAWVPHGVFRRDVDAEDAIAFGLPFRGDGVDAGTYLSGVIAVDAGESVPPGFGERFSRGVILMHELGHVMGLGHVGSPDEIMWSPEVAEDVMPDLRQSEWGPGDLEGLQAIGRADGECPI